MKFSTQIEAASFIEVYAYDEREALSEAEEIVNDQQLWDWDLCSRDAEIKLDYIEPW